MDKKFIIVITAVIFLFIFKVSVYAIPPMAPPPQEKPYEPPDPIPPPDENPGPPGNSGEPKPTSTPIPTPCIPSPCFMGQTSCCFSMGCLFLGNSNNTFCKPGVSKSTLLLNSSGYPANNLQKNKQNVQLSFFSKIQQFLANIFR